MVIVIILGAFTAVAVAGLLDTRHHPKHIEGKHIEIIREADVLGPLFAGIDPQFMYAVQAAQTAISQGFDGEVEVRYEEIES